MNTYKRATSHGYRSCPPPEQWPAVEAFITALIAAKRHIEATGENARLNFTDMRRVMGRRQC